MIHYADYIMLIGQDEQEVASTLEALVRHMHSKRWNLNPVQIQGHASSAMFSRVQQSGEHWDIHS